MKTRGGKCINVIKVWREDDISWSQAAFHEQIITQKQVEILFKMFSIGLCKPIIWSKRVISDQPLFGICEKGYCRCHGRFPDVDIRERHEISQK